LSCESCLVPPPPDEDKKFIPPDDQALCPGNADILDDDGEIQAIKFLFTEASISTKAPLYEELLEECSERSQSEEEKTEDSDATIFVYQSISALISQREEDWDGEDGTEWLRSITISELLDDQDTDGILTKDSLRKEVGIELESSKSNPGNEVDVEMEENGPIPNNDNIVSQVSDTNMEEDYFGDDEKGELCRPKFIQTVEETGPISNINREDIVPQIESKDDVAGERDSVKSTEIVLNPEYLSLSSLIPPTTPRLSRKQSLGNKIFQTLQRNLPSPVKNIDNSPKANKKSNKENIKIILF